MRALIDLVESWPKGAKNPAHAGLCALVALALHRDTGWPLVGIYHADPKQSWNSHHGHRVPNHVGVVTPEGRYLDLNGLQDAAEFLGRWSNDGAAGPERVLHPTSAAELRRMFGRRPPEQWAQAEEIAADLLDQRQA